MNLSFIEINETILKASDNSIQVKIVSDGIWNEAYTGVIIGALLGGTLAFLADYLLFLIREKRELSWYEYNINMLALDILKNNFLDLDSYEQLINTTYSDVRFSKIKSGPAIISSLLKHVKAEDFSEELNAIENRQKILKRKNDNDEKSLLMKLLDKYFYY